MWPVIKQWIQLWITYVFPFTHSLENEGFALFCNKLKVCFLFLQGKIYFSTVIYVCTFFLLNLLFLSFGFFGRKFCIYSKIFLPRTRLIFKKIFSFFKSHSLFKLFWNCDWHVFRTCRFFFLKKIEGLFLHSLMRPQKKRQRFPAL